MSHRTLALMLVALLAACTESSDPPPEQTEDPPQERDFASIATLDTTNLTFCCDPNAPFPQTVGTIRLNADAEFVDELTATGQLQIVPGDVEYLDANGNPTQDPASAFRIIQTYTILADACPPPTGWKVEVKLTQVVIGDYAVEDVLIENVCPPGEEPPVELSCGVPDQLWKTEGPIVNVTTAVDVLVVGSNMGACGGTVAGGLDEILGPGPRKYGAVLLRHGPSNTEAALAYGPDGVALRGFFDGDYGFTKVEGFTPGVDRNATDAIPTADDPDSAEAVVARYGGNEVHVWGYDAPTQDFKVVGFIASQLFPGANGRAISACRPEIGGPVYVLFNSTASQLYVKADPADTSTPAVLTATLGNDGRRVRSEGDLLFISHFEDDTFAVVNRTTLGVVTFDVGDGPIGIDTETLPNGDIRVLTTGFNDHTYTITVVHPDGTLVSSATEPVPSGGQNPGSGVFLEDGKVAISANGSGRIYCFED